MLKFKEKERVITYDDIKVHSYVAESTLVPIQDVKEYREIPSEEYDHICPDCKKPIVDWKDIVDDLEVFCEELEAEKKASRKRTIKRTIKAGAVGIASFGTYKAGTIAIPILSAFLKGATVVTGGLAIPNIILILIFSSTIAIGAASGMDTDYKEEGYTLSKKRKDKSKTKSVEKEKVEVKVDYDKGRGNQKVYLISTGKEIQR